MTDEYDWVMSFSSTISWVRSTVGVSFIFSSSATTWAVSWSRSASVKRSAARRTLALKMALRILVASNLTSWPLRLTMIFGILMDSTPCVT